MREEMTAKSSGQERDERIVLRPLRERFEQRVHARLALVERERLLLGAQLACLAVEEIKQTR